MRPLKYKIDLSESEKGELEKIIAKPTMAQNIAKRARILLMVDNKEHTNREIAKYVGMNENDLRRWTKRWIESPSKNTEERLKDRPRSGRPATITAEQWCKIMALACEKPENHGVPITHWSHSSLTAEIIKQGIVESVSPTHIGNFLQALKCSAINH